MISASFSLSLIGSTVFTVSAPFSRVSLCYCRKLRRPVLYPVPPAEDPARVPGLPPYFSSLRRLFPCLWRRRMKCPFPVLNFLCCKLNTAAYFFRPRFPSVIGRILPAPAAACSAASASARARSCSSFSLQKIYPPAASTAFWIQSSVISSV